MQSSGIETLVEELCSRLKDLQSKQGEGSARSPRGTQSVVQEWVGGLLELTGARKTSKSQCSVCVSRPASRCVLSC